MELHFCSILASPCMELHSVKKFKLSNFDKNFMPFYILVIFMFLMLCAESVAAKPAEEVINWHIHSDFSVHDLISDGKEQVRIKECVNNGIANKGVLPGGLNVPRRAHELHQQLNAKSNKN